MLLIIFEDNWADEMDLWGFAVLKKEQWQYRVNEIRNTPFPRDVYFGTNEYEEYRSPDDFLKRFKEKPITVEEAQMIEKLFGIKCGSWPAGSFPIIEGCASEEFYKDNKYYHEI